MSVLEARAGSSSVAAAIDALESDESYRKSKLGFWFWASCVWLALLILSAAFAGLLPLKDPFTAFAGVSRYPARVKCALLSWMAWKDATARATAVSGEGSS